MDSTPHRGAQSVARQDATPGEVSSPWRPRLWAAMIGLLSLGLCSMAWSYTVDDAFVLGRYADRIAAGLGYTYNAGAPTDGVTGPLGLLPGIIAASLGWDAVAAAKGLGLFAHLLALMLVIAEAARAGPMVGSNAPREQRPSLWVVAAASVCPLPAILWASAGLETGLATLVFSLLLLEVVRPRSLFRLGLWAALMPFLRPELVPAAWVLLLGALVPIARRAPREALAGLLTPALGLIGVAAWRLWLFGTPLPLSARAKPVDLSNGLEYGMLSLLLLFGGVGIPLLVGSGLLQRKGPPQQSLTSPLPLLRAAVVMHLCAVVLAGGDWMPGMRLFAPLMPTYAFALGLVASQAQKGEEKSSPLRRRLLSGALAMAVGIPFAFSLLALPEARASAEYRRVGGAALLRALDGRRRVAMVDIGWVGYVGDFEMIDLGGITDPISGDAHGGHLDKALDPGWLQACSPDAIVLHSASERAIVVNGEGRLTQIAGYPVERRIASIPWVRTHFRLAAQIPYSPGYIYVVLVRDDPD